MKTFICFMGAMLATASALSSEVVLKDGRRMDFGKVHVRPAEGRHKIVYEYVVDHEIRDFELHLKDIDHIHFVTQAERDKWKQTLDASFMRGITEGQKTDIRITVGDETPDIAIPDFFAPKLVTAPRKEIPLRLYRLGESFQQCEARYGNGVVDQPGWMRYNKDEFYIFCHFTAEFADEITYIHAPKGKAIH